MSNLDQEFGNANAPGTDAILRQIHTDPVVLREAVFFASYFDAPRICDWLIERHVDARYEQRAGEGVSIVMPDGRAFVGDHIVATDGWAAALTQRMAS